MAGAAVSRDVRVIVTTVTLTEKGIGDAFKSIDRDNNGDQRGIQYFDCNNNGFISVAKFYHVMRSIRKMLVDDEVDGMIQEANHETEGQM